MHTLIFHEPGHFHAALTLRRRNPRVADEVHLYARPGPERDAFVAMVEAFNRRDDEPTAWRLRIHEADDPLSALVADRAGDAVVLAGRNDDKLATIARLHEAGLPVLADKPWLTDAAELPWLEQVTAGPPIAMDIMTERHALVPRLRRRLVASGLLGGLVSDGDEPAIELGLVHHLYKIVNGSALRRPVWYYDVGAQGDGMVDVQAHLADQVQWLLEDRGEPDPDRDLELTAARRWSTPVPLELFADSTGAGAFPPSLAAEVRDGVLALACNGEIEYRLCGVRARQRAEWRAREPAGGGDLHSGVVRGRRAVARVRHGPETGYRPELHVEPLEAAGFRDELESTLASWHEDLPGLAAEPAGRGYRLVAPPGLDAGHESHFALVLEEFLDHLDAGEWPAALARRIRLRYTLLARGRAMALGEAA